MCPRLIYVFFFFNDTATTEIYTLSLHDALPIFTRNSVLHIINVDGTGMTALPNQDMAGTPSWSPDGRSEEHTSELQSQSNLVCRLLLEKKKQHPSDSRPRCATTYAPPATPVPIL